MFPNLSSSTFVGIYFLLKHQKDEKSLKRCVHCHFLELTLEHVVLFVDISLLGILLKSGSLNFDIIMRI